MGMNWRWLLFGVFLLSLSLAGPLLHAQTQPGRAGRLDVEKWKTLTGELDYPIPELPAEEQPLQGDAETTVEWPQFLKVLVLLVAIAIIALILQRLLSGESLFGPKNKKIGQGLKIDLEHIEANLPDADIPDFIREALQAGDYKMAVRLHYLGLIQLLARKEWIDWKRDKTNGDYLLETSSRPVFEDFRKATLVFERIWYGDRRLGARAYQEIAGDFAALERTITTI